MSAEDGPELVPAGRALDPTTVTLAPAQNEVQALRVEVARLQAVVTEQQLRAELLDRAVGLPEPGASACDRLRLGITGQVNSKLARFGPTRGCVIATLVLLCNAGFVFLFVGTKVNMCEQRLVVMDPEPAAKETYTNMFAGNGNSYVCSSTVDAVQAFTHCDTCVIMQNGTEVWVGSDGVCQENLDGALAAGTCAQGTDCTDCFEQRGQSYLDGLSWRTRSMADPRIVTDPTAMDELEIVKRATVYELIVGSSEFRVDYTGATCNFAFGKDSDLMASAYASYASDAEYLDDLTTAGVDGVCDDMCAPGTDCTDCPLDTECFSPAPGLDWDAANDPENDGTYQSGQAQVDRMVGTMAKPLKQYTLAPAFSFLANKATGESGERNVFGYGRNSLAWCNPQISAVSDPYLFDLLAQFELDREIVERELDSYDGDPPQWFPWWVKLHCETETPTWVEFPNGRYGDRVVREWSSEYGTAWRNRHGYSQLCNPYQGDLRLDFETEFIYECQNYHQLRHDSCTSHHLYSFGPYGDTPPFATDTEDDSLGNVSSTLQPLYRNGVCDVDSGRCAAGTDCSDCADDTACPGVGVERPTQCRLAGVPCDKYVGQQYDSMGLWQSVLGQPAFAEQCNFDESQDEFARQCDSTGDVPDCAIVSAKSVVASVLYLECPDMTTELGAAMGYLFAIETLATVFIVMACVLVSGGSCSSAWDHTRATIRADLGTEQAEARALADEEKRLSSETVRP